MELELAAKKVKFKRPPNEFGRDPARLLLLKDNIVTEPPVQVTPAQPALQGSPTNQLALFRQLGPFMVLYISVRA